MKLFKLSILTLTFFSMAIVNAQFVKDYRREADKYYEKGEWQSAATYYEKFLNDKKGPRKENLDYNPYAVKVIDPKKRNITNPTQPPTEVGLKLIRYRIAECYRKLDNYITAEPWYAKVVETDRESYPLSEYYYAVCLRALAKYNDAETQFSNFINNYKATDDFTKKATAELKNIKFILVQLKSNEQKLVVINKMQDGINTTEHGQNTAPFVHNNILYFTSSRPDTIFTKNQKKVIHHNNLFSLGTGLQPEKTSLPTNKEMHQGIASFSPDGKTIYFTRWAIKGPKVAAIYKSTINHNKVWSDPEKLRDSINVEGFSSQQPSLTSDGKYLLYASDKPGGKGKFDLWYAPIENGVIGASVNFGEPINSDEDEQTPFYHIPSSQLVFATQGRVGMGGFDLFQSKGSFGNSWTEPKNLGYPINSQKDEQYFFGNDDKFLLKNFYISSDRGSNCCLELFTANKLIKKWVSGKVIDSKTGEPVSGVKISVVHNNGNQIPNIITNEKGSYFIETDPYNSLAANTNKEKYEPSTQIITSDFNIDTLIRQDWAITPIPPPPPVITIEKPLIVRFEYDSSTILNEYKESLDSLAAMMARDIEMKVEIGGYTDQKGSEKYNLRLSQKRADAAKKYLIETYAADGNRITTKGYGKCCPIEKEINDDNSDNEAARKINRRLEFKMLKKSDQ